MGSEIDINKLDRELKSRLYAILGRFSEFCNENGIVYYAFAGTLIGAVRHKAIIPWDDDIDLMMKRTDYEVLLRNSHKLKEKGLEFVSLETNKDYYLPFGKVMLQNSTLLEEENIPFVLGVFIDIFPLDYSDNPKFDLEQHNKVWKKVQRGSRKHKMDELIHSVKSFDFMNIIRILVHLVSRISRYRHVNNYLNFMSSLKRADAEYLVAFMGWTNDKIVYKKEWLESYECVPFGPTTINIPCGYDKILKKMYGDYMILPPVEQRVYSHLHYYLHFSEKLSLDQIFTRKKKLISIEY